REPLAEEAVQARSAARGTALDADRGRPARAGAREGREGGAHAALLLGRLRPLRRLALTGGDGIWFRVGSPDRRWSMRVSILLIACGLVIAQPPDRTPEQQRRLQEAQRHEGEALKQMERGEFTAALQAARKKLAAEREVLGPNHADLARTL